MNGSEIDEEGGIELSRLIYDALTDWAPKDIDGVALVDGSMFISVLASISVQMLASIPDPRARKITAKKFLQEVDHGVRTFGALNPDRMLHGEMMKRYR